MRICGSIGIGIATSVVAIGALAAPSSVQQHFPSADAAASALDAAWESGRTADLLRIFSPAGERLVVSGDPVAERDARRRLAASYAQKHTIELDGGGRSVLVIGAEAWPYPIPLVRDRSGWRFDLAAGEQQILDRRIGRNELDAIRTCRAYVEAQRDYAARLPAASSAFAQKVQSAPGARDGLYWPVGAGERESPLGPRVAAAEAKGYGAASREGRAPFEGYYFRILTAQGPHASGGARSYLAGGRLTGGFALIAYPAKYGDSGVMTFIVNQDGVVFQRNLGPDTAKLAQSVTAFDPDDSWRVADPGL